MQSVPGCWKRGSSDMGVTDAARGERRALLIGNGNYQDARLRDLRAPTGDVESLGTVLADPAIGGFDVSPAVDRDIQEIHERIERFFLKRQPSDLLLLYITSHGFLQADGQLLFATPTTDMDLPLATTISSAFVWNSMEECRAGSMVLILDCCHSGAFGAGMEHKGVGGEGIPHDFDSSQARGRAVITACGHLQYATEDTREATRGSVFTRLIVEGLRTGDADVDEDGFVSVEDLYQYVFDRMSTSPSPGPLPKRKIDASGNLMLAKNPRRRGRRTNDEDRQQEPTRAPLRLHHEGVCAVAFAGPLLLVSAGTDGTVRFWDLSAGAWEHWRRTHDNRGRPARDLIAATASPSAGLLATAGLDAHARVWDLEGRERCCVKHHQLRALALSRDGTRLATAGDNRKAQIWPVSGGPAERRILDTSALNRVAFNPAGTALARAGDDQLVRVWGLLAPAETPLHEFPHQDVVWDVAFSPDGEAVASASADRSAAIWELAGRHRHIPHGFVVWSVAFSPDGARLATAGNNPSVQMWDVAELRPLQRFDHDDKVWTVTFSPDGALLATASADDSIRVWPL